jgi:hypothetical protein
VLVSIAPKTFGATTQFQNGGKKKNRRGSMHTAIQNQRIWPLVGRQANK